ncbi:MAG: tetratricopeptide repeat protein, partial [Rubrivivax sp.]|nr:tetratricopeptide repeat protein [Rubrivivax sp.]
RLAGRPRAALALQAHALASLVDVGPATVLPRARSLTERGLSELAIGDTAAARSSLLEALALYEGRGVDLLPEHADALVGLARIELESGDAAQALGGLERADAFWRGLDPGSRWAGEAAFWLGRCHTALGQRRKAAAAYARAAQALAGSTFPGDAELRREAQRGT